MPDKQNLHHVNFVKGYEREWDTMVVKSDSVWYHKKKEAGGGGNMIYESGEDYL